MTDGPFITYFIYGSFNDAVNHFVKHIESSDGMISV